MAGFTKNAIQDYEVIAEHSYNPRANALVVRFLDGSSYTLSIADLPRKYRSNKPQWDRARLSQHKNALIVYGRGKRHDIPAHVIHRYGKPL
ncbi:hypothetical protein D6833_00705 [Candidatus Parcubacteria bacterium]|nr:MAG: hypothetical protein D6833_00705 [Candidatus Parcubacteria bacterium]